MRKLFLAALALAVAAAPLVAKEKKVPIESLHAIAMSLDSGLASMFQIEVFEWSTPEERQALVDAFEQGGQEALSEFLHKQEEKGFVRAPRTLGYEMRYAYDFESDGKRQIILATNRPIGVGEVMSGSRSQKDNVSLVYLELDAATNTGTGKMIVGAGFDVDKKTGKLNIETLSQHAIDFTKVTPAKKK